MTDSQPVGEPAYRRMCRRVAETAANWADCSDMREALAVFRELGRDCQALLDRDGGNRPAPESTAYVLYDYDLHELASRRVHRDHAAALADVDRLNNVIVIQLPIALDAGPSDPTDEESQPCDCELPGRFYSGVPGAKVERCDGCQRYESDEAAFRRLVELGIARGG